MHVDTRRECLRKRNPEQYLYCYRVYYIIYLSGSLREPPPQKTLPAFIEIGTGLHVILYVYTIDMRYP